MATEIKITARIGRSGTKVHPALAIEQAPGRYTGILFICGCSGTHSGRAAATAQIVTTGDWTARTCRQG